MKFRTAFLISLICCSVFVLIVWYYSDGVYETSVQNGKICVVHKDFWGNVDQPPVCR